jgi:chromosome segregation ATPase
MSEDMVVRSLFKSVQEERDMWQDRAEAAEARAEANFQALQESEADLARTQARAEAAEARVRELEKQVVRAKMDFDGRPTNFAQAEVSLNTDIIKSLEVRAEAAEAALVKVQNDCDEWEADYARVVLLHVAERERAEAAEAQLCETGEALRAAEPYLSGIEPRTAWHKVRAALESLKKKDGQS